MEFYHIIILITCVCIICVIIGYKYKKEKFSNDNEITAIAKEYNNKIDIVSDRIHIIESKLDDVTLDVKNNNRNDGLLKETLTKLDSKENELDSKISNIVDKTNQYDQYLRDIKNTSHNYIDSKANETMQELKENTNELKTYFHKELLNSSVNTNFVEVLVDKRLSNLNDMLNNAILDYTDKSKNLSNTVNQKADTNFVEDLVNKRYSTLNDAILEYRYKTEIITNTLNQKADTNFVEDLVNKQYSNFNNTITEYREKAQNISNTLNQKADTNFVEDLVNKKYSSLNEIVNNSINDYTEKSKKINDAISSYTEKSQNITDSLDQKADKRSVVDINNILSIFNKNISDLQDGKANIENVNEKANIRDVEYNYNQIKDNYLLKSEQDINNHNFGNLIQNLDNKTSTLNNDINANSQSLTNIYQNIERLNQLTNNILNNLDRIDKKENDDIKDIFQIFNIVIKAIFEEFNKENNSISNNNDKIQELLQRVKTLEINLSTEINNITKNNEDFQNMIAYIINDLTKMINNRT